METAAIGHNSELKSYIERVERVETEIKERRQDRADIFAEAKGKGFDVPAMRAVIKRRAADAKKLSDHEDQVEVYMASLGML